MVRGQKRSGRRPGSPNTRAEILDAARDAFASDGFDRSSIRRIATEAGVDPALIHHYFGTKDQLFLAAIEAPFDPNVLVAKIFAEGGEHMGERMVETFLSVWDSPVGNRAAAFLRSAINHPQMSKLVNQFITTQIVRGAMRRMEPEPDRLEFRANLVASQLLGLAVTRSIMKLDALVGVPPAELAKIYGPTVQRYMTMNLTELDLAAIDKD